MKTIYLTKQLFLNNKQILKSLTINSSKVFTY